MRELSAILGEAIRRINADFVPHELIAELLVPALAATEASRVIAVDWSADGSSPIAVGAQGTPAPLPPSEELELLRPIMDMAARTGRIVWTEDASKDDRFREAARRGGHHVRRLGAVPIFSRGRPIGAIVYYGDTPASLTRPAAELLAEVAHCIAMAIEVGKLRESREVDEVTGLMTNRSLLARLNEETSRSTKHGRTFSLIRLDPDREVGDSEGLQRLAIAIQKSLRPDDLLARADSSDEFLLLLPETDRSTALRVAETIRVGLREKIPSSLGVANLPEDAVDVETLLLTVDEAVRRAREQGDAVFDSAGPSHTDLPPSPERILMTREGLALERMLRSLFSRELDLKVQLDLAASLLVGAVQGSQGLLAIVDSKGDWILASSVGMEEPTVEETRDRVRTCAQRRQILQDGADSIAVPFVHNGTSIGVFHLRHDRLGEHETQILSALGGKLTEALAGSLEIEKRRREALQRQESLARAVEELRRKYDFSAIVGNGPALSQVLHIVARAAETDAPVLITGESGTGKELVARAVHANSARRQSPFVVLNCAAVPPALIESELFGHTKGAYTNALEERKGLFESANRGTIFLDEIAEIPPEVQAKLLRAIQFGEIQRVGSDQLVRANVRIVAATNRDLAEDVRKKRFREDLYYRINVFRVHVPPLREHPEDIPALVEHFCVRYAAEFKRGAIKPDSEVLHLLASYPYPGNVRELENIILRAIAVTSGSVLTLKDLPPELRGGSSLPLPSAIPRTGEELENLKRDAAKEASDRLERAFIHYALTQSRGNISEAARKTGIDRSWLQKLVSKHGIEQAEFKKLSR